VRRNAASRLHAAISPDRLNATGRVTTRGAAEEYHRARLHDSSAATIATRSSVHAPGACHLVTALAIVHSFGLFGSQSLDSKSRRGSKIATPDVQ